MKATAQLESQPRPAAGAVQQALDEPSPVPARFGIGFIPNATAFIASGCIMVVEILSGRVVSPFLGSSLYTWTSAIGVVLAGISIGNYIGGRLADRFHIRRTLSVLFLLSSACCMLVTLVNGWIGDSQLLLNQNWPRRIFLHFVVVFLPPATMLGTIGPVVAKMALNMGRATGRTIGTIYAWGAVGSIVGTFLAGYFLIAWMGTGKTILTIAGILAVMGLLYGYRSWVPYAWTAAYSAAVVCALGPWSSTQAVARTLGYRLNVDPDTIYARESQYQLVRVKQAIGNRNERVMLLDKLVHSMANVKDPLDLKYEYEQVYAEVIRRTHAADQPLSGLVIGGGGFSFPRYLEMRYPGSHVEVAEIDPEVTEAAHVGFELPRDTSIKIFNMDARNHVADLLRKKNAGEPVAKFDYIFGDSIADFSVPYHLTTLEFNRHLFDLLSDRGIYMLNMIDILEPGRFLGAVVNTCRKVFPHVYVFKTHAKDDEQDTFIAINSKVPIDLAGAVEAIRKTHPFAGRLLSERDLAALAERSGGLTLTDDYAPVENLLTAVVRKFQGRGEDPHREFLIEVLRLIDAEQWEKATERCRKALAQDPGHAKAHLYLGVALFKTGRVEEAIASYRQALKLDALDPKTHVNLGLALEKAGDLDGAVAAYQAALRIDPSDATTLNHMGMALDRQHKASEAADAFRKAIALRPGNAAAHYNLGVLLHREGQFEAAAAEFNEVLKLRDDFPGARAALASTFVSRGNATEAIPHLRKALEAEPDRANLHDLLGQALAQTNDPSGAVESFKRAVELESQKPEYHQNLGLALSMSKRAAEAAAAYQESLRLQPRNPMVLNALAWMLATSNDDKLRNCEEAVRLAGQLAKMIPAEDPQALDTSAAAHACAGRFEEAVNIGRRAAELARSQGQTELVQQIESRIKLYEAGQPYRE